jgi:tetratricopeptide (TPR) repeat protein
LQIREQAHGSKHPAVTDPLHGLANLYFEQGKYEQTEQLFQRTLQIWERSLGSEHPILAYSLNNLAILYKKRGNYEKAELFLQRALSIREQALGSQHPLTRKTKRRYVSLQRAKERETGRTNVTASNWKDTVVQAAAGILRRVAR